MKCFIIVALLFAGALAAPSETAEEPKQELQQVAIESSQLITAEEDSSAREKKSAYYKPDYKPDYYKPEPVNAVFYKPSGPCAIPVLVSCKPYVEYGKLEYKPYYKDYKPEYKPEYKEAYESY